MSMFSDAQTWLNETLATAAGVSVTYTDGTYSVSLTPWVGRTVFSSNLDGAARIEFGDRDYLIPVSVLILNGAATKPAVGHRITESVNGTTKVYEIMRPDTGEPAWRYSDQGETVFRIHVKRVT